MTAMVAESIYLRAIAPHFAVADVVVTAEYYQEVLGFELRGYFLDPPVFGIVARDEIEIHLGKQDADQSALPNSTFRRGGLDTYIFVNNVTALARDLVARVAEIIEGPVVREYGRTEVIIRDCNGYKIAFGE